MRPALRHENCILACLPSSELALIEPLLHVMMLGPDLDGCLSLEYVYFPHNGMLSLLAMTPEGKTIEMASIGRHGALCALYKSNLHHDLVVPQVAMRASRIALDRLQLMLRESEMLSRALERSGEMLLLQLRQNLVCVGLHSVEQRLSRWLLEAADQIGSEVIPATQGGVAQRLGVRRTTITLVAGKLQDTGAIRWSRSRIEVLNRPRLNAETCTCYRVLRELMRDLLPVDL